MRTDLDVSSRHSPKHKRSFRQVGLAAAALLLAACAGRGNDGPAAVEGQRPDGLVEMRQAQAAFIGSGSTGDGTLTYHGRSYPLTVSGLGIGGIGISTIEARGQIYNLQNLRQSPGTSAQGRYGLAIGNESAGDLWLKYDSGAVMHLMAKANRADAQPWRRCGHDHHEAVTVG